MAFIYTQSDLQNGINAGVQGKIGILVSAQDTMNRTVRSFYNKYDLRSAKRQAVLSPNLFNGIFPYACPSDLKAHAIIDVPQQAKRQDGEWFLTTPEEFDRANGAEPGMIAIDAYNGTKILKLASAVESHSIVIAELDGLNSGGGTWAGFGDGDTVAADNDDFIKGNGSLKWNINASGGTTAGIENTAVNTLDITDYLGGTSAFFVWFKINSTTDLTNMILRFGNSSTVYYQKTVTAQADGTAFVQGWNLLKFDVASLTEVGSVTDTAIDYFAIYMTKAVGKVSETDYKFDWLVLKRGVVSNVRYYTKYGWQSSAGSYKENSTETTDLVVADTDEFELLVKAGVIQAMKEIGYPQGEIDAKEEELKTDMKEYFLTSPSEAKVMTYDYYNF